MSAGNNGNQPQASALAHKLDNELKDHIDAMLEKNKDYKYKDGLTEENWEEEIKKIPLFNIGSNEITQEQIDNSPELQALQALKYECDTPLASAMALKDDGNHNFQRKKYKWAITAYTEALKEKHTDMQLFATLYTNRAAANFHLGNNRSALNDAMRALHYKPQHMKALLRCAVCCFDLEKYDECVGWCEKGLSVEPSEAKLVELSRKATHQKKQQERDHRKEENRKIKDMTKLNKLVAAIEDRDITIESKDAKISKRRLVEKVVQSDPIKPHYGKLHLDKDNNLHWPVYFLYPESNQSDFIEDFHEHHTFADHIEIVFEVLPDWDTDQKYKPQNVEVYFEDREQQQVVHVNRNINLRTVLSDPRYLLRDGCPAFMIVSKASDFHKKWPEVEEF
jgi:tetratricopeptide (TPR) repeat protein